MYIIRRIIDNVIIIYEMYIYVGQMKSSNDYKIFILISKLNG